MGYWGSVVKKHLETLTELKFVANSKTDISEMIQNVDMVFVCTPTHTHYDIVKFCLLNNKDVFCEKPFTGSYDKAISLFDLAKSNKLNILVDHVFLYRNEYKTIRDGKNIKFIWNKQENIKQNILDSLLYHDLYMLIDITKCSEWDIISKILSNEELTLILECNERRVHIIYDRNSKYKQREIHINDKIIDLSYPTNDAIHDMICDIVSYNIDWNKNNSLCLNTLKLKEKIQKIK